MRLLCVVKYVGTNYKGWQKQSHLPSIQQEIETILERIFSKQIIIYASGRTDAGVHALGQTFHFDIDENIDIVKLQYSLNRLLPKDIHIVSIKKVSNDFHARFSSVSKEYLYIINNGEEDPFMNEYCYNYFHNLDVSLLEACSKIFIGEHCFQNFTSKPQDDWGFIRTISSIKINKKGNLIYIDFIGNGFMRYMVRNIVGALIKVSSGSLSIEDIKKILISKNRQIAPFKVPATGLYLNKVNY